MYERYGNDCTNFVSQALKAGGMWFMREWDKNGKGAWFWREVEHSFVNWDDEYSHSWTVAQDLVEHLKHYGLVRNMGRNMSRAKVGDIIAYDWKDSGNYVDHMAIVTDTKPRIRLSQHSPEYEGEAWKTEIDPRIVYDQRGTAGGTWDYERLRPKFAGTNLGK